jgi:hypothetical protein
MKLWRNFMPVNLKKILKGVGFMTCLGLIILQPVSAEIEGPMREQMEYLDFSENIIRAGLYAKQGHDVFNKRKRTFIHGITEHNAPRIYEPDVYTWELAMAEHRRKLDQLAPSEAPPFSPVTPSPMLPPPILPESPRPLQLTPAGPDTVYERVAPMPADSNERMNRMVYRARQRGLHPNRELRAEEIKQKLVDHMNSLGQESSIPALMPALPPGTRGDSCDAHF